MTMVVARVPAKQSKLATAEMRQTGELLIEPDVQVLLPPTVVPGLIKALTLQLEKYEERFGPVPKEKD